MFPCTRVWLFLVLFVSLVFTASTQENPVGVKLRFGGGFDSLEPEQQALVRKWHGEYEQITGRTLDPEISYDNLPLATRTTFDAVTHALLRTKLTDGANGQPIGNGLELVKLVESVHGQLQNARGDQQYRIYVLLSDDALDKLYRSKEFKRVGDNTIYHIGYPINFRQQGGVPSIQVSVARTGLRADIDVDYRSSSGPQALVNGHLTSANSDVRAGKNYRSHVRRWQGLSDWWGSLFGLTRLIPPQEITALHSGNNPPRLRGNIPVQDAINDFFKAWLLEEKPEQSLGYISIKAMACISEFPGGHTAKDSLVRLRIYKRLKDLNQVFGDINNLDQVMQGIVFPAPDGQPLNQPYGRLFSLQRIPDDVAREMDCRIRQKMELAAPIPHASRRLGEFYNAITVLGRKDRGTSGQVLSQVWTREGNAWKLVSWQLENPFKDEKSFAQKPTPPAPSTPPADPVLLNRIQSFLSAWLLQKKYDSTETYFAPESLDCAELLTGPARNLSKTRQKAELHSWLATIGKEAGDHKRIARTIQSVPFGHPQMQEVSHPEQDSYLLTRVSDDLATMDGCTARERGLRIPPNATAGEPVFDSKTHQLAFQFRNADSQAGTVEFNWAPRDGEWKIISFDLLTD